MSDEPKENELADEARRVLGYIREHPFCKLGDIIRAFGYNVLPSTVDNWLLDIIHDLEARYLIGVKRLRPKYELYPI